MKQLLFAAAAAFCCLSMQAKTALVVIAHGSPSESWNQQVLALESRLSQMELPGIDYTRVALMEFAQPDIPSVIRDCELQQIDTVFALPLFIAPSGRWRGWHPVFQGGIHAVPGREQSLRPCEIQLCPAVRACPLDDNKIWQNPKLLLPLASYDESV